VDDVVDAAQGRAQPLLVAHVAEEKAQRGVLRRGEALLHVVLLEFVRG
jgi:hypothetical protein